MANGIRIGIAGAGLGGVAAAGLLERAGFDVVLYDQAPGFSRLGAGIQFGPNVLKILAQLDGLDKELEAISCLPDYWVSRKWDDGTIMAKIPLNAERSRYGARTLQSIGEICTSVCWSALARSGYGGVIS